MGGREMSSGRRRGKSAKTLSLIDAAREILETIQPASVRAVCYQLFTRGVITSMAKTETNKVSTQLTWARENNLIPWAWIVDETRAAERVNAWENLAAYSETVRRSYRRDRWADQPAWIEVWSEKGTIRGTLAPVLDDFGVTFRVHHGYTSATTAYQVARESVNNPGKILRVFYLGDWDPSGLHMSDVDLPRRLARYDGQVFLQRLALDATDLVGDLPWFSVETKAKDPRYRWYLQKFGGCSKCWELDALSPVVLRDRVAQAIRARLDLEAWHRADVVEQAERDSIASILRTWPGISGPASNCPEVRP
jgi:hypothetical protein